MDLSSTNSLKDCQCWEERALVIHPLWTCVSPVFYPQSRHQAQPQQAVLLISNIFMLVTQYAKQSPFSYAIFILTSLQMVLPEPLQLKLFTFIETRLLKCPLGTSTRLHHLKIVTWCQFRMLRWLMMCPRDCKHHLLITLPVLFGPSFGIERDRTVSCVILPYMVYQLQ